MSTFVGVAGAVVAGGLNGTYGVVMKLTKKWEWENIWMLYSVPALLVFPWLFAIWSVPNLSELYSGIETGVLVRTILFGAGWGLGSVFFGLGMYMLGVSLGYTIMMGIVAVGGSIIPMLITNPGSLLTAGGAIILLAMVIAVVGVALCGMAGTIRDKVMSQGQEQEKKKRPNYKLGLLVCMGGGFFSCMLNLAFHFGAPISAAAEAQLGELSTGFKANNPIWALALLGGFVPNLLYCGGILLRKGTWKKYSTPGTGIYWLYGLVMGIIFIGSVMVYGAAASGLGKLGTTVGWLVFIVIVGRERTAHAASSSS